MNRRWGRSKAAFVMVVVGVLGISACSNDPAPIVTEMPTVTPTETPSPSPTPSPSATELTEEEVIEAIPPEAQVGDFMGADAFTRFFLVESQEMIRNRDPRLFRAISDPDCDFCNRSLDSLEEHEEQELSLRGGEIAVVSETPQGVCTPQMECHIEVDVDVTASQVMSRDGTVVEEFPKEELRVAVELEFSNMRWTAMGVGSEVRE